MTIRRYQPVGLARLIIYGFINALFMLGVVAAFATGSPAPARAIAVVAALATAFITWRLLELRFAYEAQIAWYTVQGVAVLPGAAKDWLGQRKSALESALSSSLEWWSKQSGHDLADVFNGAELAVVVQDVALKDPRYNITGRGLTAGGKMTFWFPETPSGMAEYLKNRDGYTVEALFFATVRHEAGHLCLDDLGIPVEEQHAYMLEKGFPDH